MKAIYYESDVLMANGQFDDEDMLWTCGLFSDYASQMTVADDTIRVVIRRYIKGYGKVIRLLPDDRCTRERYYASKKRIDEYLEVCRTFDAYYLGINEHRRAAEERRKTRWFIPLLALMIVFLWNILIGNAVEVGIIAFVLCVVGLIYTEVLTEYNKRDAYTDRNYVENCKKHKAKDGSEYIVIK